MERYGKMAYGKSNRSPPGPSLCAGDDDADAIQHGTGCIWRAAEWPDEYLNNLNNLKNLNNLNNLHQLALSDSLALYSMSTRCYSMSKFNKHMKLAFGSHWCSLSGSMIESRLVARPNVSLHGICI